MAKKGWALSSALALLFVAACDASIVGVRGSGDLASEARTVSGFDEIVLNGGGRVLVDLIGTESLEVEAEENLLPLLTSEVRNGRLVLGTSRRISPTRGVTYTITARSLEAVRISGSGEILATNVEARGFEIEVSGSGDVEIPEMDVGELSVRIGGSGNVYTSGEAVTLEVRISGSGSYDGGDLSATTGTVNVSGSGDAMVDVSESLQARVSGSGNVAYLGDPSLDVSVSGSGDVSRG